jgi:hypothetical protein
MFISINYDIICNNSLFSLGEISTRGGRVDHFFYDSVVCKYRPGLSNCLVVIKKIHMYVWIFIIPCLIVLIMVNTSLGKTKDGVKGTVDKQTATK